jgi:hypothetical protein
MARSIGDLSLCVKNRGWKASGSKRGRGRLNLGSRSKTRSKSEQEPSSQSTASLATHWDGYLASLGRDLINCDKSVKAVIEVAKAHTIDAADPQILDVLNRERISQLAEKHQLSVQEIKAGIRRGNVICADDYEIADLRIYGDLAEYHYNLCVKEVYFRPLTEWWPESLKQAAEFKRLTRKAVFSRRAEQSRRYHGDGHQ